MTKKELEKKQWIDIFDGKRAKGDNKKMQLRGKQIMIAEFMGGKLDPNDDSVVIFKTHFGNHVFPIEELDYHESWDMLMPVVEKCLNTDEHTECIIS